MIRIINFEKFYGIHLILLLLNLAKIKCQLTNNGRDQIYEIHLKFQSTGLQNIYCDKKTNLFGTENINIYKLDEYGSLLNINSLLINEKSNICLNTIKYNISNIKETIIIELKTNPRTLRELFIGSTVYRIERFDYPFPENNNDFSQMFSHCTKLSYVDFTNFSFSSAKDINHLFYNCYNLEQVIFPKNEKAINIEDFSNMFSNAIILTSIDLSYFNLGNARNMQYMFQNCYYLKTIIFSTEEKATNIQLLSNMFENCRNITSLNLSFFSFLKVTNMNDMFKSCSNIRSIIFPNNEKSTTIQYMKSMFYGCNKISSIDLSGLTFINTKDLSNFFNGCYNLENIIFPQNEKAENIEQFDYMFNNCSKLSSIDLSNISLKNAKKMKFFLSDCINLKNINFPIDGKANKVEEYTGMFYNCINLVSIDMSNFSFVNTKSLSFMFFNCINLEQIILPKDEIATNIEDLYFTFAVCFKLKYIDLSSISLKKVKRLQYTFFSCLNLESIIFGDDDEEINNIEQISYCFANCYNLKEINLSKFNLEKINDLSYLFYSCYNLESLTLPYIKANNVEYFTYMFFNCSKLKNIDLTNISLSNAINLDYMFENSVNLLSINFIKNEEIKNIQSMNRTFANCISLTSINLSNFYINENINLNNLFENCYSLKELNIFNLNAKQSISTNNFLKGANSLEYCLYHSYDNIHLGNSLTTTSCSKKIGFHKCGPCLNTNNNEYCTMNINGKIIKFYYLDFELNLPINERQCYFSLNFENINGYKFENNSDKNTISYYINYCNNYCEICSEDRNGCTKCKNNLYPINIDYNYYINNEQTYFYCYNKKYMSNYFFNEDLNQFIKCINNCTECIKGENICNKCNNEEKYYKIENQDGKCLDKPPSKHFVLDLKASEWRECNERCETCKKQSKSEIDHQCLNCANYYYSYDTDYYNFEKGFKNTINCWTINEAKIETRNYFLNIETERFEKCDDSCAECEIKKNNCLECQMNYYYINGYKNGTCFKNPLAKYLLGLVNGDTVYLPCFHLCKYCKQVSQSFLYQQCSECDEINYTLDLYSLNQSYCIPKDKSNSIFIQEKDLWYIDIPEKYESNLKIYNRNMKIDYQRELLKDIFSNITYISVKKCPSDRPYIIYSIRQCVSSCNSPNLIEFGIFMTKKLYFYNNICYDECPNG